MSLDRQPLRVIPPRDGLLFMAGRNSSGIGHPAMFLDYAADSHAKLVIAGRPLVAEFSAQEFEKAVSAFRALLRRRDYHPGANPRRIAFKQELPRHVYGTEPMGDVPTGDVMAFFAGYFGAANHPTIFASGATPREMLTVVSGGHHSEFSMKNFPEAIEQFRVLVNAARSPQSAQSPVDPASLIILAAVVALFLVWLRSFL